MKEVMTSFDLFAVTYEINKMVNGAHISKIYQIGTHTLLLKLRKPNVPRIQLLIEAGKRIHLTSYAHEIPKQPSVLCMSLRKHLNNGIIKAVKQYEFERIALIDIRTRQGDFQLISELFGGGNIILVNPEGMILQAMTYKRMRDRNILRGESFQHPPARGKNPLNLEIEQFRKIKEFGTLEIVKALTKFLSMSGTYAEEILFRANIDKKTSCNTLVEHEIDKIFIHIQKILFNFKSGKLQPSIISNKKDEWIDVTAVPLGKYEQFNFINYETFNVALDEYYAKITIVEKVEEATEDVKTEVARYQRILQKQKKALESLKEPIMKNKVIGDLIYRYFGDLQSLVRKILDQKRNGKSWTQIASNIMVRKNANEHPDVFFYSLDSENQVLHISIDGKVFSLNLRQSVQDSANQYYSRSKKAEKKLRGAESQLEETKTKIEEIKKQFALSKATEQTFMKRRKKEWFEKFRWIHSSDGFLILGGRDATTNEILIKKHMEPTDIVFHAEIAGAPFVLIKTGGKSIPDQTLNEAAQLAASYSKAWKEMLSSISVYWVNPNQISKTPPSGQFLSKGSFMIRGTKKFIQNVTLQIAIGVKINEDTLMIIGGPPDSVTHQTDVYVVIVPGDQKSSQLAKKIRHKLSTKISDNLKRSITRVRIEEIQKFIPLGRGKIK